MNSTPSAKPDPEDDFDRKELPWTIADRAIARYHEAIQDQAEAYRLADDRRDLERWSDLTTVVAMDAKRQLIRAILASSPDPDYDSPRRHRAEKRYWSARGVRFDGKLYLAVPDESRIEERENLDGPDVMSVLVVPENAIVDLDSDPTSSAPTPAPSSSDPTASAPPLTTGERALVEVARTLSQQVAMERLLLVGLYGAIGETIDRLGTDAVAELRRIIAAGGSVVDRPA